MPLRRRIPLHLASTPKTRIMYKHFIAFAATAVSALPQQSITFTSTFGAKPTAAPQHGPEFSLMMSVGIGESSSYVSLNTVRNGTSEAMVLVGQRLAAFPGTPGTYAFPR